MELRNQFRRQFAYDAWANCEVFGAIKAHPASRPLQLLSHVISAERLWLERIEQQPQTLPVWPDFKLERCEIELSKTISLWQQYLEELSETQLSQPVAYKNSKNEAWESSVSDVITHVLLHSAYHRGQIASKMREEGNAPAYTDFIHAVRQGFVE